MIRLLPSGWQSVGLISRGALLAMTLTILSHTSAHGAEFSMGIGALEEGDDRGRSAGILQATFANNWSSKFYLWGRTHGPVTETDGILAAAKRYDIFGSKNLHSSVGLSILAERTAIEYKDAPAESTSFTSTNVGLMLGLTYDVLRTKSLFVTASWDSHLFAAGEAVLLLVTGRKQVISVTAGIAL